MGEFLVIFCFNGLYWLEGGQIAFPDGRMPETVSWKLGVKEPVGAALAACRDYRLD
jgi:hypothetical protein